MLKFSLAFEGNKELDRYSEYLMMAEKYGFYSFQIYEHLTFRPAWAIAFHIARHAKKTLVGPVTVPVMLHHPAYTAANFATLSEASNGRAILGLSRGAFYEYLGMKAERAITAVREAVEIINILLKGGGGFEGRVFNLSKAARLKTSLVSDPEMYVGSSGPKMVKMASSLAPVKGIVVDHLWNPRYAWKILSYIRQGAYETGRNPEEVSLMARPFCSIAMDADEARRVSLKELASYLPSLVGNSPMLTEAGITFEELRDFASVGAGNEEMANKLVEYFSATGTPDDIIEQTEEMLKAGVSHVCYGHPLGRDVKESIRLLGERVLPYFSTH